jgi:hypothetical protein
MGERNKDCTLGYLCIEKIVSQDPRAPDTIDLSDTQTSPQAGASARLGTGHLTCQSGRYYSLTKLPCLSSDSSVNI